jgi:rSAM/selenodomain-associated transferase 2
LNEAGIIAACISRLKAGRHTEIIVVDGGSRDNTAEIAERLGARVLRSAASKAVQMNAGAAAAGGDVLLFLHADTCLPQNFEDRILQTAAAAEFCAGAFSLGIDSDSKGLRSIERVANCRAKFLQMPYGDQALFVSRTIFQKIGGFPEIPIMEDFALVRQLKSIGRIVILPESVLTSSRRWQNLGLFKTWLLNQIIIIAYYLGIPPRKLAQWYHREKGAGQKP